MKALKICAIGCVLAAAMMLSACGDESNKGGDTTTPASQSTASNVTTTAADNATTTAADTVDVTTAAEAAETTAA